jgi:hypothetical protein
MTVINAAVLAQLAEQGSAITALQGQLADLQLKVGLDEDKRERGRMPRPTPQWHRLTEQEREAELSKLRGFLREFGPLYGHLLKLGKCWQQHPLAVIAIEIACELHLLLFTGDRRPPSILSGQAEALIRVIPGLLQLADRETRTCDKHRAAVPIPATTNGRAGGAR